MSSQIAGKSLRLANYGITVVRPTGALAQTTNSALFNVTGGRILLTGLCGLITTAIQAQANAFNITTLSTTGAITTNLCAALDINGLTAGNLLAPTGVRTDALTSGSNVSTPNEVAIAVGSIRQVTAASSTGAIQWTLTYIPLDDGAAVAAA